MDPSIGRTAQALADADTVVALTGAGVSTASGIPDFRSEDGIWAKFDQDAFTIWRFERDPDAFWRDWLDLHDAVFDSDAAPNSAHEALAAMESRGFLEAVLTQNVDGLHQAAGSERVVELHGRGDRVVCPRCGTRSEAGPAIAEARAEGRAPVCRECGGGVKPDAVLFGEELPRETLAEARSLAERSDVFIAAGSSLTVDPAAGLPETAARTGAMLVVANDEPTPMADDAAATFRESVTEVLPALATALEDGAE